MYPGQHQCGGHQTIPLYERAKETLTQFPKLCSGVMLNRRDGEWYATFVVERKGPKAKASQVVRVAIGMAVIVSTSEGQRYGQMSAELRRRVERSSEKRRRKRKHQPLVNLSDQRTGAFARNQIGRALNQMLDELPEGATVALECLSVKDMRMKSTGRCGHPSWAMPVTNSSSSWMNAAFAIARFNRLIPANNTRSVVSLSR